MQDRKEYLQNYYQIHKEQYKTYGKNYYQNHKEQINERHHKQRKAYAKRRVDYMKGKSCLYCGTTENLVLHHMLLKDPILKNGNHQIWTWKESRRIEELLKCIVLCASCHTGLHNGLR